MPRRFVSCVGGRQPREIEMKRPFALRLATFATVVVGLLFAAPAADAAHGPGPRPVPDPPSDLRARVRGLGSPVRVTGDAFSRATAIRRTTSTFSEYDSLFSRRVPRPRWRGWTRCIAQIKQQTGKSQVDLPGPFPRYPRPDAVVPEHARPARAANVAHYVNIDGQQASLTSGRRAHPGPVGR